MLAGMWLFVIVLGIVQGLTEFLPISSSGHLVLLQVFWQQPQLGPEKLLLLDASVHFATLLAVLWVFRARVVQLLRTPLSYVVPIRMSNRERDDGMRLWGLLLIGTIPTALIGLLLQRQIEQAFTSASAVGISLLITGVLLFFAGRRTTDNRGLEEMRIRDALLIGTMQGLAIFPGISRSGFTIGAGLLLGLEQKLAAEFSFLLAVPAILGAMLMEVLKIHQQQIGISLLGPYLVGSLLALVTGIVALRWLLRLLQNGRLGYFAYYCWGLGIFALFAARFL